MKKILTLNVFLFAFLFLPQLSFAQLQPGDTIITSAFPGSLGSYHHSIHADQYALTQSICSGQSTTVHFIPYAEVVCGPNLNETSGWIFHNFWACSSTYLHDNQTLQFKSMIPAPPPRAYDCVYHIPPPCEMWAGQHAYDTFNVEGPMNSCHNGC